MRLGTKETDKAEEEERGRQSPARHGPAYQSCPNSSTQTRRGEGREVGWKENSNISRKGEKGPKVIGEMEWGEVNRGTLDVK